MAFHYDLSCPYAYLASTQIDRLGAETGAEIEYRPFLLGGLFRAIGTPDVPMDAMNAAKARLNRLDMDRWAAYFGVVLRMPSSHPNRTVLALRAVLASGDIPRATHALFRAYWVEAKDVSDEGVVREALGAVGFDADEVLAAASRDRIKAELRARTEESVALGIFGAPSFLVHGDGGPQLFWGQDRLEHVRKAIAGWSPVIPDLRGIAP